MRRDSGSAAKRFDHICVALQAVTSDKCSAQYQEAKIRTVMLIAGLCPFQPDFERWVPGLLNFCVCVYFRRINFHK